MDYAYEYEGDISRRSPASARAVFLRRTYGHLAGAILVFVALEMALFASGAAEAILGTLFVGSTTSMLFLLGAFMGVSWLADFWARSDQPRAVQYMGLGLYVLAETVIFLPLLYFAMNFQGPNSPAVLLPAATLTVALFLGLTTAIFVTGKDMSFLRPILCIGGWLAFGLVLAAVFFGFTLGLLFWGVMVGMAAASILYSTSNVLHHYRNDQYVAASLALFASVALLFWYVLRIFIAMRE